MACLLRWGAAMRSAATRVRLSLAVLLAATLAPLGPAAADEPRRKNTPADRADAVSRVLGDGKDPAEVAPLYGVTEATVRGWVRQAKRAARQPRGQGPAGPAAAGKTHWDEVEPRSALGRYTRNLSGLARDGHIQPIVGREAEVRRVEDVLERDQKPNAILLGDAGEGKTAIVEGYALRGHEGIYQLDVAALQAGTKKGSGVFIKRLKAVVQELTDLKAAGHSPVLFVDEAHDLVTSGAMDILKPMMARGGADDPNSFRMVLATTSAEYRQFMEGDGAVQRRTIPIQVGPLDRRFVRQALQARAARLAELNVRKGYSLTFTDGAIDAAADAGPPIFPERARIDVGKDLLEEAVQVAVRKANAKGAAGAPIKVTVWDVDKAVTSLSRMKHVSQNLRTVISRFTAKKATDSNPTPIATQVLGQPEALQKTLDAVTRWRVRAKALTRGKVGASTEAETLLFVGQQGLGKTRLARAIPEELGHQTIEIKMAQFGGKKGLDRFQKSHLWSRMRETPNSVVIADNIDKAHPDVQRFLVEAFQEGEIKIKREPTTVTRNSMLIMTATMAPPDEPGAEAAVDVDDPAAAKKAEKQARKARRKAEEAGRPIATLLELLHPDQVVGFRPFTDAKVLDRIVQQQVDDVAAGYGLRFKRLSAAARRRLLELAGAPNGKAIKTAVDHHVGTPAARLHAETNRVNMQVAFTSAKPPGPDGRGGRKEKFRVTLLDGTPASGPAFEGGGAAEPEDDDGDGDDGEAAPLESGRQTVKARASARPASTRRVAARPSRVAGGR